MNTQPLIALDLGSTHVACVVGRPSLSGSGYDVLGTGLAAYPHATSTWPCDPALLARAIDAALDEAARTTQLPDRASVALTHPELVHTRVTAQIALSDEPVSVRNRDLRRLSAQAISQSLPLDREVLLLQPLGYSGNGFEGVPDPRGLAATRLSGTFLLISMPLAVRRAVVQALDAAGLELQQLVYSAQAVHAACAPDAARLVVVDIGGACTDLALFSHGRLARTASIPWGGTTVVEAMVAAGRLTREQALAASLEGLSDAQLATLKQALEAFLSEDEAPDSILVTGRGALIDGLAEWIEMTTGINAAVGRSLRAKRHGELSRQVALTAAFGLLETALPAGFQALPAPRRLIEGFISRTRQILVEYF